MMKKNKKLEGIKGWLLVATISLILSIIMLILAFAYSFIELMLYGKDYFIIFTLLSSAIGCIVGIFSLIAEFKKKKLFIRLVLTLIFYGIAVRIIESIIIREFSGIGIIVAVFWILYFIDSKRVKNTFVN